MKAILVILIIVGGLLALMYYKGGYETLDPSQQGKDAMAAIREGMSVDEVVNIAGTPKRYCVIINQPRLVGGVEIDQLKKGPANPYNAENLQNRINEGSLEYGFTIPYTFSNSVAFEVRFDETGHVEQVNELATMATLLDM